MRTRKGACGAGMWLERALSRTKEGAGASEGMEGGTQGSGKMGETSAEDTGVMVRGGDGEAYVGPSGVLLVCKGSKGARRERELRLGRLM